jgi:hypothetical protein
VTLPLRSTSTLNASVLAPKPGEIRVISPWARCEPGSEHRAALPPSISEARLEQDLLTLTMTTVAALTGRSQPCSSFNLSTLGKT